VAATELWDHQTDPQENTNIASVPANVALVERRALRARVDNDGALPRPPGSDGRCVILVRTDPPAPSGLRVVLGWRPYKPAPGVIAFRWRLLPAT